MRISSLPVVVLAASLFLAACSDDETTGSSPPANTNDGGTTVGDGGSSASGDVVNEGVLAACPASTSLIETTDWTSCLAGKRIVGKEPFGNQACELRIAASGAFEYLRGGAVAITVPERSQWQGATGTYQNEGSGDRRIFLAGLAPNSPAVEGQPRVTHVNLSFFGLASQQDKVEIRYLDAALASQTYNCTVTE